MARALTLDSLLKKHKAVLIAIGSWTPAALKIPGSDLEGVYHALPLLEDLKQGKKISLAGRVIVIGGGNTAMDVARAAVRLGAKEVHVACLETLEAMPAHPWEMENAKREGVQDPSLPGPGKIQKQREPDGSPGSILSRWLRCQVDNYGNLTWTLQEGAGSESSLDADAVIIAIGQTPSLSSLGANGKLKVTPRGTLAVDPETMACNIPGLFAAGDAVVGAGTVVESMAAGRKAASSIINYLTGSEPKKKEPSLAETLQRVQETVNVDFPAQRKRLAMPTLSAQEAVFFFSGGRTGL